MPMSSSSTAAAAPRRALITVLWAWLLSGTLDISAAVLYYAHASILRTTRLLQGIASGVLGEKAFAGGLQTAMLGLALHYVIALAWTVALFVFFRRVRRPIENRFAIGMVYGVIVWMVMNLIVVPMSHVRHAPIQLPQAIVGAVILMFCIGLPTAMILGKQSSD